MAASVVGAVVGLVAFGAIAEVGNRFTVGAEVTFLPVVLATALFGLLPRARDARPRICAAEEACEETGRLPSSSWTSSEAAH